ncbi:hypothetical protein [Flavobacterium davisii]|uniref:hypothetical protein n=1 Tax=Flavobacterium davisii TaxID=2906077 RepID=UPI0035CFFA0B
MKKIYFYVIAFWSLFFVTSGFAQCTFSELAKDFSRNTALKDFVKSDSKAFDAWYLLNKEKPSLRNSLPEVKIVAENFQEVKNAGGYQKWIDKLTSEERNVPIPFLDSQQKFEQTVDVSNLPKHLRSLAYQYYKKANNENKLHLWQRLEEIFKEYKINGNWPPYNGGYNIESGISLQKFKKYDRYANPIGSWDGINEPLLGGNFTSPIIDDKPFDFSSRALNIPESNYTFYYEIEILEDLGFDGELADVIPWFNQKGQGKQVKWNIPKDPVTGRPKTWNKLAEEGKVRITIKDIPNGNAELIKKWKGYVIGKKVTGAGNLSSRLISRGISSSIADDIALRAMYIDDVIGANKMQSMIDELVSSTKFKNPEDLLENLNSAFRKPVVSGNVNTSSANDLLNELNEGKYWMNQGNEVYISRKWTANVNEVDVTITTKKALVECKNVTGGADAVRDRLDDIIKKFTDESKLSSSIKNQYPNHYGKLNISNASNPYYNLNKQQFINKIKADLLDQAGGINKNNLTNSISELHVENAQGRFAIKNTEW